MLAVKRRLAWAAAAAATAALVVVTLTVGVLKRNDLPWRAVPTDPRAYQVDSGDLSLADGLLRAGLTVPGCAEDHLRFALVDDGFGYYYTIYLRIEAPSACVQLLLDANTMVGPLQATTIGSASDDRPLTYRYSWLDEDVVRRMGWQVGKDQRFQRFAVSKDTSYTITALIQHTTGTNVVAFVYAVHQG